MPVGRQETVQLHKESAGLQGRRGSRVGTAKAKTENLTRPRLPAGPGFMPRMGTRILEGLIRSVKEGVERTRLQAAILGKRGMSIREMAGELCKPYSTIRDRLVKLHRRGPRGRPNRNSGRRKRTLNNGILKEMKRRVSEEPGKHGFKSGCRHLGMIKVMLKRSNGVVCSNRTLRRARRAGHTSPAEKRAGPSPTTRMAGRSRKSS